MRLIFTMLRSDNQTLKNTTEMEEEVPDEPSVARSEGKTGEEPMGDEGFTPPVSLDGPCREFFTVWLAAYNATNDTVYRNHKPATDDGHVHHEQCMKMRILYKGNPYGLAYAINCVFPADALQEWDIRSPQTWPRDQCSCSLWNQLPTTSGTTWLDYIEEPQYDFLAMDSVLDSFRNTDDEFGDGAYEPCHTQPTGSTVPDPTQSLDDEFEDGICEPCHTQPTGSTIPDPLQTPDKKMRLSWDPDQYRHGSKRYWRAVVAQKRRLLTLAHIGIAPIWRFHCPPGEKAFLNYVSIRGLQFASPPMEELILTHARFLADVADVIWEKGEIDYACHLGVRSIRQVEAFVTGFPRLLCRSPLNIWLPDSKYYAIQTTSLGSVNPDYDDSDTDDSSVISSPMDLDDIRFDDASPYNVWKEQSPQTIDNGLTRPGSRAI